MLPKMFPNFSPPWESRFPRPLAPSRHPQDFRLLFSVQILSYLFPLVCVYAAFLFTKCSLIKKKQYSCSMWCSRFLVLKMMNFQFVVNYVAIHLWLNHPDFSWVTLEWTNRIVYCFNLKYWINNNCPAWAPFRVFCWLIKYKKRYINDNKKNVLHERFSGFFADSLTQPLAQRHLKLLQQLCFTDLKIQSTAEI